MNSYEKLTFERLAGCYRLIDDNGIILDEEQDQIYNDLMKEVARGRYLLMNEHCVLL
ncbi:MAG: hypothetical protein ACLSDJ_09200 [Butyricimonas faecihominis]